MCCLWRCDRLRRTLTTLRSPQLIELVIIPLEWVVSKETYARINRVLMSTLFFLPLCVAFSCSLRRAQYTDGLRDVQSCAISLFETRISPLRASDLQDLLTEPDEFQSPEEDPEPYRPSSGDDDDDRHPGEREGMQISRVKFKDLKKRLPSLERSVEGEILHQVRPRGSGLAPPFSSVSRCGALMGVRFSPC